MRPVPGALAVYVGRFQPPHAGHLLTMQAALDRHGRLLVLLGSANLARSSRNPFTPRERAAMLRAALPGAGGTARRVALAAVPDEFDAARWAAHVRAAVRSARPAGEVILIGFDKDASSSYLHWFPEWTLDPAPPVQAAGRLLNATDLREQYLGGGVVPSALPPAVGTFLTGFQGTRAYRHLRAEHAALRAERAAWSGEPRHERLDLYAAPHAGEPAVWLTRRAGPIGAGLWALPGTPLNPGDRPAGASVFAHPGRSLGVPTTAHVVRAPAPPPGTQPVPLARALARPRRFFEDHHVILTRLTAH
ncbi:adenylyltransferase/cytidyltransferase family protein [Deinococcus taeanensis]|uniref:adenylyltransferase/cytidyltransferase family protein n=1 Tax=Deinococcus taeanensis TaxID=2737050 RepID=UPI001CDCBF44|nr:adenylyltransferase/cytidyltransferase family protein [Deinococcus taeanensis]UBV41629.1 adenylyltransferase/cytidyltransferase family protein [Deinococcus taeanensis]